MKNVFIKFISVIAYVAMIVVNFLANSLPINNRSTGDISNAYPNLFAPAGITFSIWGLIYLFLAGYLLYQFIPIGKKFTKKKEVLLKKINLFFIASSICNILWIFAWHYDFIGLSVIIMSVLLFFLIKIADVVKMEKKSLVEKFFIYIPFSIYFGWISVAAIANVTVFLVSVGWNGFGISDFVWTSVVLLIGLLIGTLRMLKDKNVAYGLVLVWAYLGILYKHLSPSGFDGQYTSVIVIVVVCLALFGISIGWLGYKKINFLIKN